MESAAWENMDFMLSLSTRPWINLAAIDVLDLSYDLDSSVAY